MLDQSLEILSSLIQFDVNSHTVFNNVNMLFIIIIIILYYRLIVIFAAP